MIQKQCTNHEYNHCQEHHSNGNTHECKFCKVLTMKTMDDFKGSKGTFIAQGEGNVRVAKGSKKQHYTIARCYHGKINNNELTLKIAVANAKLFAESKQLLSLLITMRESLIKANKDIEKWSYGLPCLQYGEDAIQESELLIDKILS